MKINLKVQVINGVKGGRKVYGPGVTEMPDGLAKQCLRDGIATELSAEQVEAIAAVKAEADAEAKAKADADSTGAEATGDK